MADENDTKKDDGILPLPLVTRDRLFPLPPFITDSFKAAKEINIGIGHIDAGLMAIHEIHFMHAMKNNTLDIIIPRGIKKPDDMTIKHRKHANITMIIGLQMLANTPPFQIETPTLYLPPDQYRDHVKWKRKNMNYGFFNQTTLNNTMKHGTPDQHIMLICKDIDGHHHPVTIFGRYPYVNGMHKHYHNPHIPRFAKNAANMIEICDVVRTLRLDDVRRENIHDLKSAEKYIDTLHRTEKPSL